MVADLNVRQGGHVGHNYVAWIYECAAAEAF